MQCFPRAIIISKQLSPFGEKNGGFELQFQAALDLQVYTIFLKMFLKTTGCKINDKYTTGKKRRCGNKKYIVV